MQMIMYTYPKILWVSSSVVYAFHPTMFFQLGVYSIHTVSSNFQPKHESTERIKWLWIPWSKQNLQLNVTACFDAGPLVRIKQALTRLKQEVQQMDVRIGVVSFVVVDSTVESFFCDVFWDSSKEFNMVFSGCRMIRKIEVRCRMLC